MQHPGAPENQVQGDRRQDPPQEHDQVVPERLPRPIAAVLPFPIQGLSDAHSTNGTNIDITTNVLQ